MNTNVRRVCSALLVAVIALSVYAVVLAPRTYAASVKLNKSKTYLVKGKTTTLKVKGTKTKVKWASKNKSVATVTKKGVVKGKGYGQTYVTAKVKGKTLKCKVIVAKSAQIKARQLRDYILKKGKEADWGYGDREDGNSVEGYAIGYSVADDYNNSKTARIIAYRDTTELIFTYNDVYDDEWESCYMTIDLIKQKSGTFSFHGDAEYYSEDQYDHAAGEIDKNYNGTIDTLTFTSFHNMNYDNEGLKTASAKKLNEAFKYYNKIFKNKKLSSTMKNIGFSKWAA